MPRDEPVAGVDRRRQPQRTKRDAQRTGQPQLDEQRHSSAPVARQRLPGGEDEPPAFVALLFRDRGEYGRRLRVAERKQRKALSPVERGDDPRRPATEASTAGEEHHRTRQHRHGRSSGVARHAVDYARPGGTASPTFAGFAEGYGGAVSARLFGIGWLFHLKGLTNSLFFVLVSVLQPVIFASIAFFMVESGNQAGTLLYVALGAGLMGIWSATLFGSGGAIQWQRWQGTLELLVGAPPPFVAVLLPLTVATATIGIYSVAATLVWGRLFFAMPLDFAHPLQLAVALPTTILSLGMLGLLLASTFVLYRHANAFSNLLEYPVWLATGLLVPLTLLPGWVAPISWVLSPTWGMRAIREAAFGGDAWPEIGLCTALGFVYLGLGAVTLRNFERLARSRATLSLT